ncbi:MAG: toll/interleukin-1 receptor domain-containing protein [Marinosulfonomonas sp.]
MANKIFISHKNTDAELAASVAKRIEANGLETYLDTIDDALVKDGPDLADMLLQRMELCNQLIAVVSEQTKDSWWVPWEIGVGSEKNFRMASYSRSYVFLPSYLKKWPELHSDQDIDLYCQFSKRADLDISLQMRSAYTETAKLRVAKSGAQDFHHTLMRRLSRGY